MFGVGGMQRGHERGTKNTFSKQHHHSRAVGLAWVQICLLLLLFSKPGNDWLTHSLTIPSLSFHIYNFLAEASFSAYLFAFLTGKNSMFGPF